MNKQRLSMRLTLNKSKEVTICKYICTCEKSACKTDEEPSDEEQLVAACHLAYTHEDTADHREALSVPESTAAAEAISHEPRRESPHHAAHLTSRDGEGEQQSHGGRRKAVATQASLIRVSNKLFDGHL